MANENEELSDDQLESTAGGAGGAQGGCGGGDGGINQEGDGNVSCIGEGGLENSNMEVTSGGSVRA